jgi:nitroimidazol reductase NimA-like FMN-containing flavoprotein (pyridoxamine 5'-phosphate oxidase superfamily)
VRGDDAGLEVLSESECMQLLEQAPIGRVGVNLGALPAVLPVNFAVLDGDIVIRTGGGTKLDAALSNAVVAFEVDGFDEVSRTGWSVMLTGVAKEITDPAELERAQRLPLRPWAPRTRDRFVRIASYLISGRRIPSH